MELELIWPNSEFAINVVIFLLELFSINPLEKHNIISLLVDKYSNTDWLRLRDLLSRDFNRVPLAIPVSRVSSSVALGN